MSHAKQTAARFDVGRILMTRGAADTLHADDVFDAYVRHMAGDWGDVDAEDWERNEEALTFGSRLLSAYCDRSGNRFWIITEADRSATTILLPSEY